MSDQFFLRSSGKVLGPFSWAQLQDLRKRGRLHEFHEVSSDRISWLSAGSLPELFPPPQGASAPAVGPQEFSAPPPPVPELRRVAPPRTFWQRLDTPTKIALIAGISLGLLAVAALIVMLFLGKVGEQLREPAFELPENLNPSHRATRAGVT